MKAKLIKHDRITDELGNTTEIKMWSVPKSANKPYGFKYSLVYIVNSRRIMGYDNAEEKETTDIIETGKNRIDLIVLKNWRKIFTGMWNG